MATKWEHCRLSIVFDEEGEEGTEDSVGLVYFRRDEPRREAIPVFIPEIEADTVRETRMWAVIETIHEVVTRLGAEGWQAFQVSQDATTWMFKREVVD